MSRYVATPSQSRPVLFCKKASVAEIHERQCLQNEFVDMAVKEKMMIWISMHACCPHLGWRQPVCHASQKVSHNGIQPA